MSDYDSSDSDHTSSYQKKHAGLKELPWSSPSVSTFNENEQICLIDEVTADAALEVTNYQTSNLHSHSAIAATRNSQLELENGPQPKEINILLLGESGVGKSTFINSFANYMKHEHFEAVEKSELSVLIPSKFHIFDKEYKQHIIEIGVTDHNECLDDGAAATQDVKTYVFNITLEDKHFKIRLIDTPGMGDPRGIDQDNKNCDYVLNYLSRLKKIHSICLLLKPTNTRLDVFLNYCVVQILSRLEKSATQNICFLFTNTRGQNYTPGETYTQLELLVKKIKDNNKVTIPLSHDNVFCFDNEAFRFLASIKQNIQFREGVLEANIESWKCSYKEVYRLLSYIVLLNPHDAQKTVSINNARKMVLQLSQPLAEIVQLIGDNIYQLDQHTRQLLMENQTLDDLKKKLYMPVIDIIAKELPQPVTVCTSATCSSVYKVGGKNKFHYKQRCHNPCYLKGISADVVGAPQLLACWAINKSTQICHQCNCRFNTHMHIYYETETFENKIIDENIQQNILTKEDIARRKQEVINQMLDQKEQLEKEHKHIIKCSAAFAHFLQKNAITPINDSLKEYVKYLITREESLGAEANKAQLDYLKRILKEYEEERNVLTEAMKHDEISSLAYDSPNMIERKVKELFTLKNFGSRIKLLYDLHQSGGLKEHKQSEHVVKERYNLTKTIKSYGHKVMAVFGITNSRSLGDDSNYEHHKSMELQRQCYMQKLPELEFGMKNNLNLYNEQGWPSYFGLNMPETFVNSEGASHSSGSRLPVALDYRRHNEHNPRHDQPNGKHNNNNNPINKQENNGNPDPKTNGKGKNKKNRKSKKNKNKY